MPTPVARVVSNVGERPGHVDGQSTTVAMLQWQCARVHVAVFYIAAGRGASQAKHILA